MKTLFSVIVPTYNRQEKILPTLHSILAQSFDNFELIVVDDGSTDKTAEIIKEKLSAQKKLHYFYKKNEERSVARNFGIEKAKGEFLVFFDSDDFMHPDCLEVLAKNIQKFPENNFFVSKFQIRKQKNISFSEINSLPEGFYSYESLLRGNVFRLIVLRKNALKHLFPPQFRICEDWIFNFLNIYEDKIFLIDRITYSLNDHEERSMNDHQKIITARMQATAYILDNCSLNAQQENLLWGHSFRFCAIHAYADQKKGQSWVFWKNAFAHLGFSTEMLLLLLRIGLGKTIIDKLK